MGEGGYAQTTSSDGKEAGMKEREVQWWGGHCTSTREGWRREGGSEARLKHRDCIDISSARLRAVKAGASPLLSLHPYRPVAAVSCVRLLVPAGF